MSCGGGGSPAERAAAALVGAVLAAAVIEEAPAPDSPDDPDVGRAHVEVTEGGEAGGGSRLALIRDSEEGQTGVAGARPDVSRGSSRTVIRREPGHGRLRVSRLLPWVGMLRGLQEMRRRQRGASCRPELEEHARQVRAERTSVAADRAAAALVGAVLAEAVAEEVPASNPPDVYVTHVQRPAANGERRGGMEEAPASRHHGRRLAALVGRAVEHGRRRHRASVAAEWQEESEQERQRQVEMAAQAAAAAAAAEAHRIREQARTLERTTRIAQAMALRQSANLEAQEWERRAVALALGMLRQELMAEGKEVGEPAAATDWNARIQALAKRAEECSTPGRGVASLQNKFHLEKNYKVSLHPCFSEHFLLYSTGSFLCGASLGLYQANSSI